MPSDPRLSNVLDALRGSVDVYEAALRGAGDRMDALLAASVASEGDRRDALQLGEFATGRIDVERFSALHASRWALDDFDRALLSEARRLVQDQATLDPRRLVVDVPSGGRMSNAVAHAMAELGRAFGAALVAEMLRRGVYEEDRHKAMLHSFPRYQWSRMERDASPPLVVLVDGADLWAGELTPFLDGNQRFALIVRGPAPPAALVRVVTPGTLVFQTSSETMLHELFTKYQGVPSVGALVPEGAAEFVHAPQAGRAMHERLTIGAKPKGPRKALPGWTVWQQEQELEQLVALATPPAIVAATAGNGAAPVAEPADRLAAWLLSQSEAATPVAGGAT